MIFISLCYCLPRFFSSFLILHNAMEEIRSYWNVHICWNSISPKCLFLFPFVEMTLGCWKNFPLSRITTTPLHRTQHRLRMRENPPNDDVYGNFFLFFSFSSPSFYGVEWKILFALLDAWVWIYLSSNTDRFTRAFRVWRSKNKIKKNYTQKRKDFFLLKTKKEIFSIKKEKNTSRCGFDATRRQETKKLQSLPSCL